MASKSKIKLLGGYSYTTELVSREDIDSPVQHNAGNTEQLYGPSPAPTGAEDLGASLHLSRVMFISSVEQAIFME